MENSEIRETLRQLEAVWQRVGAAPAAPPPPQEPAPDAAEPLRGLIRAAEAGAQRYRALSRLTRGCAAAKLLGMAAERSRDARALQEQHFLLAGDSLRVARKTPAVPGLLRGLRQAWSEEAAYGQGLTLLAQQTADAEDRARLDRMREASEARRSALRELIRQGM